jgi:hypothetical protein
MNLYLVDDSVERLLIHLLIAAGRDIQIPSDVNRVGYPDAAHLLHAINVERTVLTANHDDFRLLHELVVASGGHHPGILVICKDNDRSRDMSSKAIVRAIDDIDAAGFDLHDQFQILNHWR